MPTNQTKLFIMQEKATKIEDTLTIAEYTKVIATSKPSQMLDLFKQSKLNQNLGDLTMSQVLSNTSSSQLDNITSVPLNRQTKLIDVEQTIIDTLK